MMADVSAKEIQRQYRVLRQVMGMHAILRDRYRRRALGIEIALLLSSVVFCATTFAGREFFSDIGVSERAAKVVLGIASVVAFGASLVCITVKWKERSLLHEEAFETWASANKEFRQYRLPDGTWPIERMKRLSDLYWRSDRATASIPEEQFLPLKCRHLRKVEASKLSSRHPGCPLFLLRVLIRLRDSGDAIRGEEDSAQSAEVDGNG